MTTGARAARGMGVRALRELGRRVGRQVKCAAVKQTRSAHSASQGDVRKIALVQGASRGLGLEFASALLERQSDSVVVATCRRWGDATTCEGMGH